MSYFRSVINTAEYSPSQLLMLASFAMNDLGWQYAFENQTTLIGRSKMGLFSQGHKIKIVSEQDGIMIESRSLYFDLLNQQVNRKNVESLIEYIGHNKILYPQEQLSELHQSTFNTILGEQQFHNSGSSASDRIVLQKGAYLMTYSLIGVNILLYGIMVCSGVSLFDPGIMDLHKWGANMRLYTLGGEWWRLITSIFLHGGVGHLLTNMLFLFFVGRYLEPVIGKWRFAIIYLCTGVISSLATIWWSGAVQSVGASGAIFGMYGTFIALLTTHLIDARIRFRLLQSFIIFIVYSLMSGMQAGIDNAAHTGGLISGMIFGFMVYVSMKHDKAKLFSSLIVLITLLVSVLYLTSKKKDKIQLIRYTNSYSDWENIASTVRTGLNLKTQQEKIYSLEIIARPAWAHCSKLLDSMMTLKPEKELSKEKIMLLKRYIDAKITENDLLIIATKMDSINTIALDNIRGVIYDKLDSLKKIK